MKTVDFTENVFINNIKNYYASAPFNFDNSKIIYPEDKMNEVNEWIKMLDCSLDQKTNMYHFLTLTGRSGDGKTFVAQFIAEKDIYVVFLINAVLRNKIETTSKENLFKEITNTVYAHLVVLNDLIDHYSRDIVTPMFYLNVLLNGYGKEYVLAALSSINSIGSLSTLLDSINKKSKRKVIFFNDEAHEFAGYFKGEIDRFQSGNEPGNALTVLARVLNNSAPSVYASTTMSGFIFEYYVSTPPQIRKEICLPSPMLH